MYIYIYVYICVCVCGYMHMCMYVCIPGGRSCCTIAPCFGWFTGRSGRTRELFSPREAELRGSHCAVTAACCDAKSRRPGISPGAPGGSAETAAVSSQLNKVVPPNDSEVGL